MIHDVIAAEHKRGYRVEIEFDDGKKGVVDFACYLERGGVFEQFRDIDFFKSFSVSETLGTLTWGSDVDIAPETLYAAATNTPLPAWMQPDEEEARIGRDSP